MATIRGGEGVQRYLERVAGQVSRPATLRVGFLEGATYPDGTPVAMVAAIHNWGAPRAGIPPRPFFSNMIAKKQAEWGPATARLLEQNNYDIVVTFRMVGEAISGQLRQEIINTNSLSLAASTIRRKGFAKPLINTSHMINSTDYEVRTG